MPERPLVVVSNRGPLSFSIDGDELAAKRGAGGLVTGLAPLVADGRTEWLAAAISEGDRAAAAEGIVDAEGFRVRLLAIDPETYRMAYDVVCNATLWFIHHGLFELARRPRFDTRWRRAWDAYRDVNRVFADEVAATAPEGAAVLVQDYHLTLLAPTLADARPDLRVLHFSHTPFAGPDLMRVLPTDVATEMLESLAAHHACGFHTARWAAGFEHSCRELIGRAPTTFVSPLAPDPDDIAAVAAGERCAAALASLDQVLGSRRFIVRVDRMELSKNIVRGFVAFDELLAREPALRGEVVFGAFCYPSREGLPEYLAYRQEVETVARQINERWGTESWTPIMLDTSDDFPGSVAALRRADVVLINPIRDGLNLVAKEAALVNEHDAPLVLSIESGVWSELEGACLGVNPYDIDATVEALAQGLFMPADERAALADRWRARARARTPADWLADQRAAAEGPAS